MRTKTITFILITLALIFISLASCKVGIDYNLEINILPSSAEQEGCDIIPDSEGPYIEGTEVTLTIETSGAWFFEEWDGTDSEDVIGSGTEGDPYKIIMDGEKSLTAVFNTSNEGYLSIDPDMTHGYIRIDSHAGSEATPIEDTYPNGTTLTLYATPEAGYYFTGWTGVADGSYDNPIDVDIFGETLIGANFEPLDNSTVLDEFEGDFSEYWHPYLQNHSISAWPEAEPVIDNEEYVNGDNSMKLFAVEDAPVTHQRRCFFNVHVDVAQDSYITFWYKIDSYPDGDDGNYDKLLVMQDDGGEDYMWIDGEVNWTKHTLQVTAGVHEISFGFYNFNQNTWGRNAAWIDDVVFGPDVTPILPEPEVKVFLNDNNNDDTVDPENLFEVEIDPNDAMPIDLGRLVADEPVQFTFQNRGLKTLEITDITMDTSGSPGVNLDTSGITFPITVPPYEYSSYIYETGKFEVTLPSTTGAVSSGQIEITSNDGVNPSFTYSFSGTALQTVFNEDFEGTLTPNIWSDVFDHPVYSNYTGDTPPVISNEEAYSGSESLKFAGDGIDVNHIIKAFTVEVNSSTGAVLSFWINSNIIPYFVTQHANGWDYVYTFPDAYFLMSDDFEDDGDDSDGKPFLGHEKWSFRHHTNGWHQAIIELDQVGTHEIVWKFGHAGSIDDPVDERVYVYLDDVIIAGDASMVSMAGDLDVKYDGNSIPDGNDYDIGSTIVGDPITIDIENLSDKGNLTITNISMDGSNDASYFDIISNPTDGGDVNLLPLEKVQFILSIQDNATPITSGVITIESTDPTTPSRNFTITADPINAFFTENFEASSGSCDWTNLASGNTWTYDTYTNIKEGTIVYDLSAWSGFINPKYDTTYPSSGECYVQFGVFEETEGGFSNSEPIDIGETSAISIDVDLSGYTSATIYFDAAAYFWENDPVDQANKFTFSQDGTVKNTIMQEENIQYTTYSVSLTTGSVSTLTWTFDKTDAAYSARGDATWLDNILIIEN